ncbi:I78 family peptidase inhibitor [Sphingomonas adhaesiva]|uniref:I78 family peptidase inhibitor n=1 Tax=Sphingomonas adhaesiva TaxID=28212 RepID=UPI002FFBEE4C
MKAIAILTSALVLTACATAPAPKDAAEDASAGVRCNANAAEGLIGRPADAAAALAQKSSGARTLRRYVTGSPVTMDFRPDRLNVETDAAGTIVKLTCG